MLTVAYETHTFAYGKVLIANSLMGLLLEGFDLCSFGKQRPSQFMEWDAELKLANVFVLHSEWVLDGVVGQAACDRVSRGAPKLETADFEVEVNIADLNYTA